MEAEEVVTEEGEETAGEERGESTEEEEETEVATEAETEEETEGETVEVEREEEARTATVVRRGNRVVSDRRVAQRIRRDTSFPQGMFHTGEVKNT